MSYLQAIAYEISNRFLHEPASAYTCAIAEAWLNEKYPEAVWFVSILDQKGGWLLELHPDFLTPEFETYFKLKYL